MNTATHESPPAAHAPAIPPGYWHAHDSLRARHGLDLDLATHARLSRLAASPGPSVAILARHQPDRALVAFHLDGRWVPAIWAADTATVITFLPAEALDLYRRILAKAGPGGAGRSGGGGWCCGCIRGRRSGGGPGDRRRPIILAGIGTTEQDA